MIPAEHLDKTAVFHITHVENLASMLGEGRLTARNFQPPGSCRSIANEEVQDRRARVVVPVPPGGPIHDYVPFYFAPRSPMLFCNHRGSIPNARPQGEIIYLVTTAQNIAAVGRPFAFYDRHAVVGYAQAFNRLEDLKQVDWRVFFEPPLVGDYARYWQNRNDDQFPHWVTRKEVRQAEFLAHQWLPLSCIRLIGTYNRAAKERVEELFKLHGNFSCPVETRTDWYFT
jgi:hypothetical protein